MFPRLPAVGQRNDLGAVRRLAIGPVFDLGRVTKSRGRLQAPAVFEQGDY